MDVVHDGDDAVLYWDRKISGACFLGVVEFSEICSDRANLVGLISFESVMAKIPQLWTCLNFHGLRFAVVCVDRTRPSGFMLQGIEIIIGATSLNLFSRYFELWRKAEGVSP